MLKIKKEEITAFFNNIREGGKIEINIRKFFKYLVLLISGPFTLFHAWTAYIFYRIGHKKALRQVGEHPKEKNIPLDYDTEDTKEKGVCDF